DTNDSALVAVTGVDGRLFRLLGSAAKALQMMQQSAMKDGIGPPLLLVESGYRSDEEQKVLYEDKVNEYMTKFGYSREKAQEEADIWVAPPGCSAHRTGRAIDLNMSIESTSGNAEALKKTKEYEWLKNNAAKFGFCNYEVEPWHWEYNPIK
ncbi:MAG TPA: M15 family metallopeptidase, partial [Clostridia bacterium]